MLGDSMIEPLQQRAAAYARASDHRFISVIWYGSRTIDWGSGPRLSQTLQTYAPSYVMVVLGSNELYAHNVERRTGYVRKIVQVMGSRRFIWIGPPNWRKDTGLNAMLKRELGNRFFSSEHLELERRSDGIHPTDVAGALWMDRIVGWVRSDASTRLLQSPATDTKRRHAPARVWPPPGS